MKNELPAWCRYVLSVIGTGKQLNDDDYNELDHKYGIKDEEISNFLLTYMQAVKRVKRNVKRIGN